QQQQFVVEDSEPFVSTHLDRYIVQDEMVKLSLSTNSGEVDRDNLLLAYELSGKYPDTPTSRDSLKEWQQQAEEFALHLKTDFSDLQQLSVETIDISLDGVNLQADLPWLEEQLFFWRLANAKGKDDMRMWIHHLIAQVYLEKNNMERENNSLITQGVFRGEKQQPVQVVKIQAVDNAEKLLSQLIQYYKKGMLEPLLLHSSLGKKHCANAKKPLDNKAFYALWLDDFQTQGLGSEPYVKWFWSDNEQQVPQWQGLWKERIEDIYLSLYQHYQIV
ncbi:MAG: hypothetical protein QM479_16860, partial [Pseudomonadota bacterium]